MSGVRAELTTRVGRLPALDAARGLAVLAMFAFHLIWDLGHFRYIDPDFPFSPGVKLFGHAIAIGFLFIAGVSLTLARRNGAGWRGFWKRIGIVGGAAALVSLGTWLAFPQSFVFFGILHCIAAASLLAAPFLLLPWPAAAAAALAAAAAPLLLSGPAFDAPALRWLGLNTIIPFSNDYRPLLPWAAALLAGVAFGNSPLLVAGGDRAPKAGAPLTWLGRHSLILYLVHQPLFFGVFLGLAALSAQSETEPSFGAACVRECVKAGRAASLCKDACACAGAEAAKQKVGRIADEAIRRQRLGEIARACIAQR